MLAASGCGAPCGQRISAPPGAWVFVTAMLPITAAAPAGTLAPPTVVPVIWKVVVEPPASGALEAGRGAGWPERVSMTRIGAARKLAAPPANLNWVAAT